MVAEANKLLLNAVRPAIRKQLVSCRIRAMSGQIRAVLRSIDHSVEVCGTDRIRDLVALSTLKAELLHLNGEHSDALDYFRGHVIPHKSQLSKEEDFAVEQNLSDLEFATLSPGADITFYTLVDRRRLAGIELFDAQDILAAQEAAADNKHYTAIPIIWRQLFESYRSCCWMAARWANKQLATETFQLEQLSNASYYAVVGILDAMARPIGEALLKRKNADLMSNVVRRLQSIANLRSHFVVACEILQRIADGIPDDCIESLIEWLHGRCRCTRVSPLGPNEVSAAWKTITAIAHRLSRESALSIIKTAVEHPLWVSQAPRPDVVFLEREYMVQAVCQLVALVDACELPWIIEASLPLATERRQIHDYSDVVNLLCHVADRGSPADRERISTKLTPTGSQVDAMLFQVVDRFRPEALTTANVEHMAEQVEKQIKNQVQILEPGQDSVPVAETLMTSSSEARGKRVIVSSVGGVGLYGVARHRHLLSGDKVRQLVSTVVSAAQDRNNHLGNRAQLIYALRQFADRVDAQSRQAVWDALATIADGRIDESEWFAPSSNATDPMNPYRINHGQPSQLRARALVAMSEFAKFDATLNPLALKRLEIAIFDRDEEVRQAAFAAIAMLPHVSGTLVLAVLFATRDPEPTVAAAAFFALSKQNEWEMPDDLWGLFVFGLRVAASSVDSIIRRNAAAAANRWQSKFPNGPMADEVAEILREFKMDVCYSVRRCAGE